MDEMCKLQLQLFYDNSISRQWGHLIRLWIYPFTVVEKRVVSVCLLNFGRADQPPHYIAGCLPPRMMTQ